MIRTYNRTFIHRDLREAKFIVYVTQKTKYETTTEVFNDENKTMRIEFKGIKAWAIVEGGKEAEEIEANADGTGIDDNHEYLILYLDDKKFVFRNTYTVLFII